MPDLTDHIFLCAFALNPSLIMGTPSPVQSIPLFLPVTDTCRILPPRPGQDELLIRRAAEVFCTYLSPEEKVEWIEQSVPYEGRIPCEGAEEDMICQIRQSLEDPIVDIRQDGDEEMRALGIEATLSR